MPHKRQDIRDAVVTALVAADTAAETRVHKFRVLPLRPLTLPAISVYTAEETTEATGAPRRLLRTLSMEVVGFAKMDDEADDTVEDKLDDLALEIERAMHADPSFGLTQVDSQLTNTLVQVQANGNRPIGAIKLTYEFSYHTNAPEAADVEFDNLENVEVTTKLGNTVHADNSATNTVDGLEE